MDLGNQKILLALFISIFTFAIAGFVLFIATPAEAWAILPPMAREIVLFFVGFLWAITMIIIAKADSFKLYIGKIYTPKGEVTKGSKNEKIFYAIIIVFVLIVILCGFIAFSILGQFP